MISRQSLSLVYLAYNEADNLPVTVPDALDFCRQSFADWELIVVDDGSIDGSADVVRALMSDEPRLRLISHDRNLGMGGGMATGIREATKDLLVFNAADGQVSPWQIERLITALGPDVDIVLSTYENVRESLYREGLSRGLRLYMRLVAGIQFRLQGLYVIPTAMARSAAADMTVHSFFFSFELIQRAVESGARLAHTTMRVRPRLSGTSKVTGLTRIAGIAREVWAYRQRRR